MEKKEKSFVVRWREAVWSEAGPSQTLTRAVLAVLAEFMDPDGSNCFPSIKSIADATRMSERSVKRHLAEAQALGWIRTRSRGTNGQGWRRNLYVPAITERGATQSPPIREATESPSLKDGATERENVGPLSPKRGVTVAHDLDHYPDHDLEGAKRSRGPRSRATQLSAGFAPDQSCIDKAKSLGVDLKAELEKFSNHAQANGRTAKNWQAAFRNWLIKSAEFGNSSTIRPSQRHVSPSDHRISGYD